jgi:hypothetical protein
MTKLLALLGKYLGVELAKTLLEQLARWYIGYTGNKIDDACLALADKIKAGTITELGISEEMELIMSEFKRLREEG